MRSPWSSRWASAARGVRAMANKTRANGVLRTLRRVHPAWAIAAVLLVYVVCRPSCPELLADNEVGEPGTGVGGAEAVAMMQRRAAAINGTSAAARAIGNHFCVLQPTLSTDRGRAWTVDEAQNHIALRAFMRTFADTVEPGERARFRFSVYYAHDSTDPVFGVTHLRRAFADRAQEILRDGGFERDSVRLVFSPMYGLHGRINAIWNFLAKDAYYDGCDYFFMSNDDMVFFTRGWVARATDSLAGIGSRPGKKRPCRNLGIVRFKDEWASWAVFTFHVSTRLHLEIFGGVYYPVPYYSAHNDLWIHYVYSGFESSKLRGEIRVRNRVEDVDFALNHQKDKEHVAPPRYKYDKLGNARKYILEGRARLKSWLEKNRNTDYCLPPL